MTPPLTLAASCATGGSIPTVILSRPSFLHGRGLDTHQAYNRQVLSIHLAVRLKDDGDKSHTEDKNDKDDSVGMDPFAKIQQL